MCTLMNIYAPNEKKEKFFINILSRLGKLRKGFVVLAGYFNMTMDIVKDKSKVQKVDKQKYHII